MPPLVEECPQRAQSKKRIVGKRGRRASLGLASQDGKSQEMNFFGRQCCGSLPMYPQATAMACGPGANWPRLAPGMIFLKCGQVLHRRPHAASIVMQDRFCKRVNCPSCDYIDFSIINKKIIFPWGSDAKPTQLFLRMAGFGRPVQRSCRGSLGRRAIPRQYEEPYLP